MNIGQAAHAAGLSSKAVRYYEDVGLVVPARDQSNDYRVYSSNDVERLRFLQRGRAVGFSLEECSELLALHADSGRRCEQVRALMMEKVELVDRQLSALTVLRETLMQMANECSGNKEGQATVDPDTAKEQVFASRPVAMSFTLLGDSDGG